MSNARVEVILTAIDHATPAIRRTAIMVAVLSRMFKTTGRPQQVLAWIDLVWAEQEHEERLHRIKASIKSAVKA